MCFHMWVGECHGIIVRAPDSSHCSGKEGPFVGSHGIIVRAPERPHYAVEKKYPSWETMG